MEVSNRFSGFTSDIGRPKLVADVHNSQLVPLVPRALGIEDSGTEDDGCESDGSVALASHLSDNVALADGSAAPALNLIGFCDFGVVLHEAAVEAPVSDFAIQEHNVQPDETVVHPKSYRGTHQRTILKTSLFFKN